MKKGFNGQISLGNVLLYILLTVGSEKSSTRKCNFDHLVFLVSKGITFWKKNL